MQAEDSDGDEEIYVKYSIVSGDEENSFQISNRFGIDNVHDFDISKTLHEFQCKHLKMNHTLSRKILQPKTILTIIMCVLKQEQSLNLNQYVWLWSTIKSLQQMHVITAYMVI